jgi:glycine/D-amino acid oxidase-like deaminating enzyme
MKGEDMNSLWKEFEIKAREPLHGDTKTDILIIGGGLAGIVLALELQNRGADYLLVEGKNIAGGVTGGTTGKITLQHGLIYSKTVKEKGIDTAKKYFASNEEAVEKYKKICARRNRL